MSTAKLRRYRQRRRFDVTSEPAGDGARSESGRAFVVQKHDATRLHYDFRLESDGVLLSWAVPKGPSLSPKDKRLAVRTEDHPIDYKDFEGTIPEGEYGGGPVIVWDRGTWEPVGDPHAGLEKGRLDFDLHGDKLHGRFVLVRTRRGGADGERQNARPNARKESWLLVKRDDDFVREGASADVTARQPRSVLTGRTIEDVERGVPPAGLKAAKLPAFGKVAPQLATLVTKVPSGGSWIYELKYDGYRILARLEDGAVRLASRNGKDWTRQFPEITGALSHVRARTALFDGEVAYVLPDGRTDFQRLQSAMAGGDRARIVYFAFDLLHLDGVDLTGRPLLERKDLLRTVLAGEGPPLRMGDHVTGDGDAFLREACRLGLEGILAKRGDAPYRIGRRGPEWVKAKCHRRQEMVIVGFTPPKGGRTGLGALLLAVRDGGGLRYAGKVGTGFSQASLADLTRRLTKIAVAEPSASGTPRMRGATWVRPELVCEVRFTEWTREGLLRHPSFEGLREDKRPTAVTREEPASSVRSDDDDTSKVGHVTITHPKRVIDPVSGVTKAELARYHEAVSSRLLPYAKRRPLMLMRCPEGRTHRSSCFVQKHSGRGLGSRVGRSEVEGEEVLFATKPDEIFELVQFNVVELHGWGSRMPRWDRPDWIVLDLDPDEGLPFSRVVFAARTMKEDLASLGLESFVKTTGGKGLHVVVPIAARHDWATIGAFAEAFARAFVARAPSEYVATMSKAARRGKIFVDHFRNGRGATAILPYSPRARDGLPVATPIAWRDLASVDPRELTVRTVPGTIARGRHDPWAELLTRKQTLSRRVLEALGMAEGSDDAARGRR